MLDALEPEVGQDVRRVARHDEPVRADDDIASSPAVHAGARAQNPNHVYVTPGDYVVRLTVSGPGGTDFVEQTVSVFAV